MNTGGWVVAGIGAYAVTLALLIAAWSTVRGRVKRREGRAILAERGVPDYRYATGPMAGRWASEVLVEDLDLADEARGR